MRTTCTLLLVALMLGLSSGAWAQDGPGDSPTPSAAASKAQGGDVLWYGKAPPGWGGVVGRMKLLAPGVGWAERGGRFYWTADNGANWTDITPPSKPGSHEQLSDIFFLDTHRGWALFARYDKDEPQFDLASTSDAGATWTRTQVSPLPAPADYGRSDRSPLRGWGGKVAFQDSIHGWLTVTLPGETMNTWWSFLLVTSDGGQSWKQARHAPALADADALLVTASEGWLLGRGEDTHFEVLYVTRDAAHSWQKVSVPAPKEVFPATETDYDLPTFSDNRHGNLLVSYSYYDGANDLDSKVLFATDDGGRTWKPDRIVKNLDFSSFMQYSSSTAVGSDWIFAASCEHHPVLTKVGPGARIDASTSAAATRPRYKQIRQVSFATPAQGWAIVGDGELQSTTDGGATWTTLLPGPQPHVIEPHGSFIPRQSMQNSAAPVPQVPVGWGGSYSKHLGFDTDGTPSVGVMQAWWEFSPYHDVGIYLNGARRHTANDPQLNNSIWVSTVINMGWGLIPIWVGSNAKYGDLDKDKTEKDGKEQGKKEADSAKTSAENAGISPDIGNIIYYDMEQYDCDCDQQVEWLLSGWIQELQKSGYLAGVYLSGSNAKSVLNNVNPDAVWVAATGKSDGTSHLASIWQLQLANGTLVLKDYQFPSHERIHQFNDGPCNPDCTGILNVMWDGSLVGAGSPTHPTKIDLDIEDSRVVGGQGQKPIDKLGYSDYPFSVFGDCTTTGGVVPGLVCSVAATGINNPPLYNSATGTKSTVGEIVGEIWGGGGGGPFIPAGYRRSTSQVADSSGKGYPCGVFSSPFNGKIDSFDWGFSTGYSDTPLPFIDAATCFAWEGANQDGGAFGLGISNLSTIVGGFEKGGCNPAATQCSWSWFGCQMPGGSSGLQVSQSCPSPSSEIDAGINDVGWMAVIPLTVSNNGATAVGNSLYLDTPASIVPVNTSVGLTVYGDGNYPDVGINGFGQVTYNDGSGNGYVWDYNPASQSGTTPVSGLPPLAGINNNNEAVSLPNILQDVDILGTAGQSASICPAMAGANGINDWGQIVGSTYVDTGSGAGFVQVGDVCIPNTGNE